MLSKEFLEKGKEILDRLGIKCKTISTKEEIVNSKSFDAILIDKTEHMKKFCNESCIFYEDNSCRGVMCDAKVEWEKL